MSGASRSERSAPRRLELSLSPEDGSLLTSPLSTVLLSATDGLYTDLYQMAHGELDVTTTKLAEEDDPDAPTSLKKEKMSNLSFAQRRHELGWRLTQHGKSLTQVAALAAACSSTDFAQATVVSTKALQHARTAWVQADEAQDALFFFHAQLFPARQAPHDVYGAMDILENGNWKDLPSDLKLVLDRYRKSTENSWDAPEARERWYLAVRDKLIRGEVGWMRQQPPSHPSPLWKASINGGIVRLTHGKPKMLGSLTVFPIEAKLTVLSTAVPAQWTLLSVEVHAQARTGESNHQIQPSRRQRFDLHRLCVRAMFAEENQAHQEERLARPLQTLFLVAQNFSLSWQLEILSAQAQALKKGVWESQSNLVVTPVRFMTEGDTLGVLSISFWRVDDRYGPPCMGALNGESAASEPPTTNQLSLTIRADQNGIQVSLSGGDSIRSSLQSHSTRTVEKLLEATSNPFALSASNALLAATMLCTEQKCHVVVEALQQTHEAGGSLPSWMELSVKRGSIAVGCRVSYHGSRQTPSEPVVLFRLECDARTGNFVCSFSRSTELLRALSCNDVTASSVLSMRMTKKTKTGRLSSAASQSTGRVVRDAFEGLARSMNLLGIRAGVGGRWNNRDAMSQDLRKRSVQLACNDVKSSLVVCCGIAAVYGLGAVAIGVATGVNASPDM